MIKNLIASIRSTSLADHWDVLKQDSRYALRVMGKNWAVTTIAVLTLALGIGANTAIFSVLNGIVLRSLPYKQPERIVVLRQQLPKMNVPELRFSVTEVNDYRQQNGSLSAVVEYHPMRFVLQEDVAERVRTGVVSWDYFDFFGIKPFMGRFFSSSDEQPGATPAVVLTYEYWRHNRNGDREIVGKTFKMNDKLHTIIGVMPSVPQYPDENDVYITTTSCPFRSTPAIIANRNGRFMRAFARLKPGITVDQASSDVGVIAGRLQQHYPVSYSPDSGYRAYTTPLSQELTRKARPVVWTLLAAAGFVLLIACANVANFTLARLSQREQELMLRSALGADKHRLVRQLFTESLLLGVFAAGLGILFAFSSHKLLVQFIGRLTPRAREISIDGWVLLFAAAAAVLSGVITSSLLALSSKYQMGSKLKEGNRQASASTRQTKVRNTLIVAQVAFSLALLVAAGLLLRSFSKLQSVDPGFASQKVLTMSLDLSASRYPTRPDQLAASHAILSKVEALPGVASAAVGSSFPLDPDAIALGITGFNGRFLVEGANDKAGETLPYASVRYASIDYFKTLGIPLIHGRSFQSTDIKGAPGVVMANEAFVQHRIGQDGPIGRRVSPDRGRSWYTIVGVVGNTKELSLSENSPDEVYYCMEQATGVGSLLVRATLDPTSLATEVRKAVIEAAPETAFSYVITLEQARDETLSSPRVMTSLLAIFAGLALVIAASGIGGILALSVSQRVKEIGIRLTLGAQPVNILRMVVGQGMMLVVAGLVLGLIAALAMMAPLKAFLFHVSPMDPLTVAGVSALLAAVAWFACYIPARKATRINPTEALRHE